MRSRSNSGVPRLIAQSQTRIAPPTERAAACQSAGISGIAALAATWFSPQRKQQKTMVTTANASRWALRSVIAADGKGAPAGERLGQRRRERAGRPAPLAWANGAMAMSQPAGWRSASAAHGVSLATLSASAARRARPIARRRPRAVAIRCTATTATPAWSTPERPA